MNAPPCLVIATGSAQARALIDRLTTAPADEGPAEVVLLPAEDHAEASPRDPSGVNEMILTLQHANAGAVIDAGHPFDAGASATLFTAARTMGLPYLRLLRKLWDVKDHPRWRSAPSVAAAMPMITPGARVFATTGWPSLAQMAGFPGATLLLRQTARRTRDFCHPFVEPVFGLPPFTKASETQLFEEMGVDLLLARNLGSTRSYPKLAAALALGIDVILVSPPPPPEGAQVVRDIYAALDWWRAL